MFRAMAAIKDFAQQRIEQCLIDLNRIRELKNTLVAGVSKAADDYNSRASTLVNARKDVLTQESGEKEDKDDDEAEEDEDNEKKEISPEPASHAQLSQLDQPVSTGQSAQSTPIPRHPVQSPTTTMPTNN